MNNINSFNICPRCGNSNSLNAKFCSRCGGQLKRPDETVICPKCHARNSSVSNFCRSCGASLRSGVPTKTCPDCGREVNVEDKVCACGHQFISKVNVEKERPQKVKKERKVKEKRAKRERTNTGVYSNKGGRLVAIFALLFVLIFSYLIVAPASQNVAVLRPEFLSNFDMGIINRNDGAYKLYAADYVKEIVDTIGQLSGGTSFGDAFKVHFGSVAEIMMLVLVIVLILNAFVHLIVSFVRIFTKKRSKRANWWFFAWAVVSTLVVGLMFLFKYVATDPANFFGKIASVFIFPAGTTIGFVAVLIPLYFWFFFFYSLGAKAKTIKEDIMEDYDDAQSEF